MPGNSALTEGVEDDRGRAGGETGRDRLGSSSLSLRSSTVS